MTKPVHKSAAIIGSTRGIGFLLARHFASTGWGVAISGRNSKRANDVANQLNQEFKVPTVGDGLDVSELSSVDLHAKRIASELAPLQLVIYCAGVLGPVGPPSVTQVEEFADCLKTNVLGFFNIYVQFVVPRSIQENRMTVIALSGGGTGGDSPIEQAPAYVPSKSALVSLIEILSSHAQTKSATLNAIAPGNIPSDFLKSAANAGPDVVGAQLFRQATDHASGDPKSRFNP
jgi:NAD(P)-dependent dehydrogenase (short-subunit alcohol dehydrogenase family)